MSAVDGISPRLAARVISSLCASENGSSGGALASEAYAYYGACNVETKVTGGVTTTYGYDTINQLTSETRTGYSAVYTYDANGIATARL